jgi:hypothetical protein
MDCSKITGPHRLRLKLQLAIIVKTIHMTLYVVIFSLGYNDLSDVTVPPIIEVIEILKNLEILS